MTWRRRSTVGLAIAALVTAGLVSLVGPATSGASGPTFSNYVALGDSYTADVLTTFPPTTRFVPIGCAQSTIDYPHQLAKLLHVTAFFDASCGSATTDNMTKSQSVPANGVNPPQFSHLSAATTLVTIGIGGNDVGLVSDAESCFNLVPRPIVGAPQGLGASCAARDTAGGVDQISADIAKAAPKIATVLKEIHTLAPRARVLLVNYLDAVPLDGRGCWPIVPVQSEDVAYLAAKFMEMNNMLGWMATLSHVQVVDVFSATIGHDVCSAPTVRDVEGVIPLSLNPPGLNFPLHPNGAGAAAQAAAVYAAIVNTT